MKRKDILQSFFNLEDFSKWKKEWVSMPEFVQEDLNAVQQIIINFATQEDVQAFSELIGQKLTSKTQSVWYPKAEIFNAINYIYTNEV